jgi:hypothetical protein
MAPLLDIAMLVAAGGRERTLVEFDRLLTTAGLTRIGITPIQPPYMVIEAVAASPAGDIVP